MPTRRELFAMGDDALIAQCEVDRIRGSGKGGQKKNKTSSQVRLRHQPTKLAAMAGDTRSQHTNKAHALRRLRERFAFDWRDPIDLDDYSVPPELAEVLALDQARKSDKWLRSPLYLQAVGQLLDLYKALGCSLADTARRLDTPQARIDRLSRIDRRLARKLAELRSKHLGT